jgi:transcriptional regulator with XRE-family HTH domain
MSEGGSVTDNDQEMLGTLAEQYLDYLSGARPEPPPLEGLTPAQRRDARASWKLLNAARQAPQEYTPPPLDADPLALALGLVADPERRLSGSRLKRARIKRRLQASQLAELLTGRGWDVSTKTVVRWEMADSAEITPALLTAMAEVLRVPAEELATAMGKHNPAASEIQAAAATPQFADLARRWAAASGQSLADARTGLQRFMEVATVRRGRHLTAEEWLAVLEDFIDASSQEEEHGAT